MRPLLEREREPPPPHSAAPISIYTWSSCVVVVYDLVSPSLTIRSAHPFVYSTITIIDRYDVHYTESIILVGIIDSWKFRRRYPALLDTSPTPYDISFGCLNIGEFHNAISAANNNNRLAQQLKFDEYIRFKRTRRERERGIYYLLHSTRFIFFFYKRNQSIKLSFWERERERRELARREIIAGSRADQNFRNSAICSWNALSDTAKSAGTRGYIIASAQISGVYALNEASARLNVNYYPSLPPPPPSLDINRVHTGRR